MIPNDSIDLALAFMPERLETLVVVRDGNPKMLAQQPLIVCS